MPGVDIAGVTFDAGPVNSPVLLQVGTQRAAERPGAEPGRLERRRQPDRPAGRLLPHRRAHVGKATVSLEVNSDHVVLDDIWAWRADHGNGVGWTHNTADTGLVVNGDHVTATGLFVEHYQKTEVIWNGEHGERHLLPERAALRPAEPGRLDVGTRPRGLPGPARRRRA